MTARSALKMPRTMQMAALAAAVLVLLTGVHALNAPARRTGVMPWTVPDETAAAVGDTRQCSIYHARFGGNRARLVRVIRGEVANFVVIEVSRGNRVVPAVQRAWLRATFGEGEPLWLGEFASPDTALAKAARLCPESARCSRGEPDCGPDDRPFSINAPRET
jgi:hypothetical protein